MAQITHELIEDIIFWEKHTEIYQSLESFLSERYKVTLVDLEKKHSKNGVRFLLDTVCAARMENAEKLRNLEPELTEKFIIEKKDKNG